MSYMYIYNFLLYVTYMFVPYGIAYTLRVNFRILACLNWSHSETTV